MEIEEVVGLTNRIRNVLVNLAQRTAFEKEDIRRRSEETLEEKRLIIEQANLEIMDLDKSLKAANEEVERQKLLREEADKYAKQVEESNVSNKALAESYREKNDTLTGLVTEYKSGFEESKKLREELADTKRLVESLNRELAEECGNLESLAKISDERLRQAVERAAAEIERANERKEIEKERELIRLRTELQEQAAAASQQSTGEIKSLYDRIDKLRTEQERHINSIKAEYERQIAKLKNQQKGR